jgi:putative flavoprotein involved in K+ transport
MEQLAAVVVGGGQAGLAVSTELTELGIEHAVLERGRVAQTWRDRWDSFCLVTPNWTVQLPGYAYDGDDPDGFMPRDELVAYFERYAAAGELPVREGVDVRSIERSSGAFTLRTSTGDLTANAVVIATGAYQRPHRPEAATTLPSGLLQLDVEDYRSEQALPPGRVLVVGSGQSGCQIAEELHGADRDVVLACGKAPWFPRHVAGRDYAWWALESGVLDASVETLPSPAARLAANVLTTGHGGGRDLHLRTLRAAGVTLTGRFLGAVDHDARFAPDLAESVAWGDNWHAQFADRVRKLAQERNLDVSDLDEPAAFDGRAPAQVDLRDFGAVLFATGFRPDYEAWLPWPGAFDEHGFPIHDNGESTARPGIYFVGVHFLRKRKSSLLIGVGEDAAIVAQRIASRVRV